MRSAFLWKCSASVPILSEGLFREYLKPGKQNPLGLLFCNRNGRAYTSQKVIEYHLWSLLHALKIKRAGFHLCGTRTQRYSSMVVLRRRWRSANSVIQTRG
jgi:hypothetical protein